MAKHSTHPGYKIEPLSEHHDRTAFSCGVEAPDIYLHRQANQDLTRKTAAVFVLIAAASQAVLGFYTLSSLSLLGVQLPDKLAKKLPSRSPLGVTLFGRMAVSTQLQGTGLGEFLLLNALERAWQASQHVASWAVVVDAKQGIRDFYLQYGFIPLPSQPHRLFLPIKTIERLFSA